MVYKNGPFTNVEALVIDALRDFLGGSDMIVMLPWRKLTNCDFYLDYVK